MLLHILIIACLQFSGQHLTISCLNYDTLNSSTALDFYSFVLLLQCSLAAIVISAVIGLVCVPSSTRESFVSFYVVKVAILLNVTFLYTDIVLVEVKQHQHNLTKYTSYYSIMRHLGLSWHSFLLCVF